MHSRAGCAAAQGCWVVSTAATRLRGMPCEAPIPAETERRKEEKTHWKKRRIANTLQQQHRSEVVLALLLYIQFPWIWCKTKAEKKPRAALDDALMFPHLEQFRIFPCRLFHRCQKPLETPNKKEKRKLPQMPELVAGEG